MALTKKIIQSQFYISTKEITKAEIEDIVAQTQRWHIGCNTLVFFNEYLEKFEFTDDEDRYIGFLKVFLHYNDISTYISDWFIRSLYELDKETYKVFMEEGIIPYRFKESYFRYCDSELEFDNIINYFD